MSNHSVIEHRANYHYVKVEEDYIAICLKGKASPHCKALILSILEQWTNTKRDKHEEPVVYMTYPQWIKATYWYHGRNVIIESLQELVDAGFITRKPYHLSTGKDTFAYVLNVETVQEAIKGLPEKPPNDTLPSFNLNAFKNKRVPNQTRPKSNGSGVYNQTPDAFNKERILSSTTQLPDIPSEESNAVPVETVAPAFYSSQEIPVTYHQALAYLAPHGPHEGLDAVQVVKLAQKLWTEAHEENDLSEKDGEEDTKPRPIVVGGQFKQVVPPSQHTPPATEPA